LIQVLWIKAVDFIFNLNISLFLKELSINLEYQVQAKKFYPIIFKFQILMLIFDLLIFK